MKLGIMQPYFFPHLGYFDLIYNVDRWIVFDQAQYIRHGWVNRNRILKTGSKDWQYIVVPLKKHHQNTKIKDIQVHPDPVWKKRLLGQLQHYKKRAPFFKQTLDVVSRCLENTDTILSRLNAYCLEQVCAYLSIPFCYDYFSELNLPLGPINEPGDWALEISKAMGASLYLNAPGGKDLFDTDQFIQNDIQLVIRDLMNFTYDCPGYTFQSCMSIIDVMMWNSPEAILDYLTSQKLDAINTQSPISRR